jgi:hypothetical protein
MYPRHGSRTLTQGPPSAAIFETEAPTLAPGAGAPEIVTWDPSKQTNPGAAHPLNRGCPAGYFAELVAPRTGGAISYGDPNQWVRCRLLRTTTAATIQRETGRSWRETLNIATSAARDTGEQLRQTLPTVRGWLIIAIGGALALGAAAFAFGAGGYTRLVGRGR